MKDHEVSAKDEPQELIWIEPIKRADLQLDVVCAIIEELPPFVAEQIRYLLLWKGNQPEHCVYETFRQHVNQLLAATPEWQHLRIATGPYGDQLWRVALAPSVPPTRE